MDFSDNIKSDYSNCTVSFLGFGSVAKLAWGLSVHHCVWVLLEDRLDNDHSIVVIPP